MAAAPVASPFPAIPSSSPLSTSTRHRHSRAFPPPPAASPRELPQQQQRARGAAADAGERRRRREEERADAEAEEFERQRKEEVNRKIASRKALSIILRRDATKAVLDKREPGKGTRRLLPRTVLEALHERIAALRWESALKVFELMRDQVWCQLPDDFYNTPCSSVKQRRKMKTSTATMRAYRLIKFTVYRSFSPSTSDSDYTAAL